MHIELEARHSYASASNLFIFPENDEELVRQLADLQGYDLEETFMFSGEVKKHPFPTPVTVLDAFKKYCDITSLIRKKALKELAQFAADPRDKERLELLASLKGKEEFRSLIEEPMLTVADLFSLFPSVKVPVGALVQILDRIQPRAYSISSSPKLHPEAMHIVVQLTKKRTCEGKHRYGLCSSYFHKMFITGLYSPIKGFLRDSVFRVPRENSSIIMVAIGSGIAPFRALAQELQDVPMNEVLLLYGCKDRNKQFVYKKDIEEAIQPCDDACEEYEYRPEKWGEGPYSFTKVYCAFSRERSSSIYVQDVMLSLQDRIWERLSTGGYLYVCGSTAMGKSILELLGKIAAEQDVNPKEFIDSLRKEGRLAIEMWG